jgi:putative acetyltransferase
MAYATPQPQALAAKDLSMQIRQYEDADLDSVTLSWESATRLAHPFMTEEFLAQERRNLSELYLPNTDTWVVEIEGTVAGFIALMGNEVGAIFVQPKYHGKGAGKILMDKAKELHGDLEVEVFSSNAIGRNFYTKYGFELYEKKMHEQTGQEILRLKFAANQSKHADSASAAGV